MTDFNSPSGIVKKIIKVSVVGEMGTGKTSLIRQYVHGNFSEFYKTTIGVDFANKDFNWDDETQVSLQLWDIAGQERYGNMTHMYYQESSAAIIVFDVSRISSLECVDFWKKDLDSKVGTADGKNIPVLLLGNKIDMYPDGGWGKTKEEMDQFCKEHDIIGFFETSAKNDINIDDAAHFLLKYIMDNHIEPGKAAEGIDIEKPKSQEPKKAGCCK